ncbi:putative metallophosphoesterase, partial [Trifolium medium]|nr:putative metallophosphoesterase [Trifolium medium]
HHPNRAQHFNDLVGPALSIINPSLVLITGDLTEIGLSISPSLTGNADIARMVSLGFEPGTSQLCV